MEKYMQVLGFFLALFLGITLLGLLATSVRIINAGEVGIKTEFGKVTDILEPNIYFIVPIMNDVKYLSTQIEKFEVGASAASKDLQIVDTSIAINYQISGGYDDIKNLYESFRGNHEQRIIAPLVQEVVKSNTAKFNAAELITNRVELKTKIANDLKQKLEVYGINVVEVSITNLDFSTQFNAAIETKVVAEQTLQKELIDLETKKIEVQKLVAQENASAESKIIRAEAEAIAKVITAEADANSTIIRANAESEAIKKITESISDPYIRYYYIQEWNGELPKVLGENDVILDLNSLNGSE